MYSNGVNCTKVEYLQIWTCTLPWHHWIWTPASRSWGSQTRSTCTLQWWVLKSQWLIVWPCWGPGPFQSQILEHILWWCCCWLYPGESVTLSWESEWWQGGQCDRQRPVRVGGYVCTKVSIQSQLYTYGSATLLCAWLLCAWLVLVHDKHMWPSCAEIKYFVCFPGITLCSDRCT